MIRRQGGGVRETFTVRKVSFGVGVERTFPVHTPVIEKIEVVTRGDVRRAKLYYLRDLRGKSREDQGEARARSRADLPQAGVLTFENGPAGPSGLTRRGPRTRD